MTQHEQTFSEWKQNISDFLSLNYEKKGYSPLVGKIFTQLMFATEPLSLQDIVEQLGVTKAAVSVQIRNMERNGMCRKMPSNNDRKDYYYMSENYSLNHIRRIMHDLEVFHKWAENTIQQIPAVETSAPEECEALKQFGERFSQIATMYNNLFPIIKQVEIEWEKCVLERKKEQGKNNKN